MHRVGSSEYFEYNQNTRRWDKRQMPTLTDGEKAVLTLSIQGYTMSEIADRICLSPDTIILPRMSMKAVLVFQKM